MKKLLFIILLITPLITFSQTQKEQQIRELAYYHLCLGTTLFAVYEDYKGAVAEYSLAIQIDPTYGAAYRCRGSAKNKLGLKDEACKDFNKAKELGDEFAQVEIDKYCKEIKAEPNKMKKKL